MAAKIPTIDAQKLLADLKTGRTAIVFSNERKPVANGCHISEISIGGVKGVRISFVNSGNLVVRLKKDVLPLPSGLEKYVAAKTAEAKGKAPQFKIEPRKGQPIKLDFPKYTKDAPKYDKATGAIVGVPADPSAVSPLYKLFEYVSNAFLAHFTPKVGAGKQFVRLLEDCDAATISAGVDSIRAWIEANPKFVAAGHAGINGIYVHNNAMGEEVKAFCKRHGVSLQELTAGIVVVANNTLNVPLATHLSDSAIALPGNPEKEQANPSCKMTVRASGANGAITGVDIRDKTKRTPDGRGFEKYTIDGEPLNADNAHEAFTYGTFVDGKCTFSISFSAQGISLIAAPTALVVTTYKHSAASEADDLYGDDFGDDSHLAAAAESPAAIASAEAGPAGDYNDQIEALDDE